MRGMSPAAAAKKRLGAGGFALGCGCKDAKAVAVAASSASPYSTEASTATSATWRRVRAAAHPSASGSTGTLTVPSASSSSLFPWEDAEADGDGEEVNCGKRENTPSFSGLLRQLNELEQSVVSWGRKSTSKSYLSPPRPPPSLPSQPVAKQRAVHSGDRHDGNKEGHGDFTPLPQPPPRSFQFQTQLHMEVKGMDKGVRPEEALLSRQPLPAPLPLQPEQPRNTKSTDKGSKQEEDVDSFPLQQQQPQAPKQKEDMSSFPLQQHQPQAPKHRKAKSLDGGAVRLDGTVAVVKQSDDPLSDFRRSMVNMIVENRIVTGDELRELLRHFLALNAPRHHDAILRAFTEIWDEAFSTKAHAQVQHRESSPRPTPPQQRAPPPPQRHRHTARVWR